LPAYNFSQQFPNFPFIYRRSVIKDAIGKVRSYLSNLANWRASGKKQGKNLAVITVRQDGKIIETLFVTDRGLDRHRYGHLKRIARKQWQSGTPVKGEHSNQQLWRHVRRMNEDAAQVVARRIVAVCARYPGCVLLFERLRKLKAKGGSKSRRMNRRQANQLRGKINRYSRDKAYAAGTVTVEVNPHGTSQYCSRCGAKGERFSYLGGKRIQAKWGKLFRCPVCHYEANADFNASVNVHRSFYRQWHWQPRKKPPPRAVMEAARSPRLQVGGKKLTRGTPR
jgi:transposase